MSGETNHPQFNHLPNPKAEANFKKHIEQQEFKKKQKEVFETGKYELILDKDDDDFEMSSRGLDQAFLRFQKNVFLGASFEHNV